MVVRTVGGLSRRGGEGGGRTGRPPRAARHAAPLGQAPSGGGREQRRAPRAERATPLTTTRADGVIGPIRIDAAEAERNAGVERARVRAPFGTKPARAVVRGADLQARAGCLQLRDRRLLFSFSEQRHAPHRHGRGGGLEPAATSSERALRSGWLPESTVRSTRSYCRRRPTESTYPSSSFLSAALPLLVLEVLLVTPLAVSRRR